MVMPTFDWSRFPDRDIHEPLQVVAREMAAAAYAECALLTAKVNALLAAVKAEHPDVEIEPLEDYPE